MNNNDIKSSQFSTSSYRQTDNSNNYNGSNHMTKKNSLNPSIWTTNTSRSSSKSNFTSGSNDFHFIQTSDLNTTKNSDVQNGSTAKLIPYADDQSNSQVSFQLFVAFISVLVFIILNCCCFVFVLCNFPVKL